MEYHKEYHKLRFLSALAAAACLAILAVLALAPDKYSSINGNIQIVTSLTMALIGSCVVFALSYVMAGTPWRRMAKRLWQLGAGFGILIAASIVLSFLAPSNEFGATIIALAMIFMLVSLLPREGRS